MNDKTAALAKAPWPVDSVDPVRREVRITGKYVHPKLWDRAGIIGLVVAVLATIVYAGANRDSMDGAELFTAVAMFAIFGGPFILVAAALPVYFLVRRKLDVTITADAIKVGRKTYPRNVDIEFSVQAHRKALKEAEKPRPDRTWMNAIEVVMRYGEARVSIAEMRQRDREKAVALVFRLGRTCERFEAIMAQAAGEAMPVAAGQPAAPAAGDFGPAPDVR